jgi:hypothetical protein
MEQRKTGPWYQVLFLRGESGRKPTHFEAAQQRSTPTIPIWWAGFSPSIEDFGNSLSRRQSLRENCSPFWCRQRTTPYTWCSESVRRGSNPIYAHEVTSTRSTWRLWFFGGIDFPVYGIFFAGESRQRQKNICGPGLVRYGLTPSPSQPISRPGPCRRRGRFRYPPARQLWEL